MTNVTVIYAAPDQIWSARITLATSSTVAQAVQSSGVLACFKELKLEQLNCGIFGKAVTLTEPLKEGDRVEIYRDLFFDPKQSRRRRAIHRQKIRNIKKKVPINDVTT
jgi:putative ubiquitin-RnfH superfamily antitoxin RatB of RatAB toxin-antitoxin module